MSEVTFKVFRFDPQKDSIHRYQEYKITLDPGITLLNSLNKIKAEQDPSLTYRMSCGSAICGSCAMRVNGHALLACKTQASELVKDGVIQVDPIGNCEVLRDLVVDLEPFWASLRKVDPWLKPDSQDGQEDERLQTPDEFRKIDYVTTCILCGACWSDCNVKEVDKNFLGPATLAKAHRFIFDTRDAKTGERLENISELHGVWDCTHCGECSTRCPTDTKPLSRIEETREKAMANGVHNNTGARHALAFRKTVGSSGRLNENLAPVLSKGLFNIAGHMENMPVGIRMLLRGKLPPIFHHSIEKLDEVRKIFSKYEDYRK
ncbi:Succinate dehydrogenase iron-sulfur protein [hydrothermal vent metagenome]|uniref:succinate dehydrogenase n=1 Tax=hydrothermal vent metagenome TaxID=652676 RepID=A0A3B1BPH6_9ZZZZ